MTDTNVELKNAEAYCATCDITRRFVIPKWRPYSSVRACCGICLQPLKLVKALEEVPAAPESGTYLIADPFRKAL